MENPEFEAVSEGYASLPESTPAVPEVAPTDPLSGFPDHVREALVKEAKAQIQEGKFLFSNPEHRAKAEATRRAKARMRKQGVLDLQRYAREKSHLAIDFLEEVIRDRDSKFATKDRLQATTMLLDRGYGRPASSMNMTVKPAAALSAPSTAELEQMLAEKMAAEKVVSTQ